MLIRAVAPLLLWLIATTMVRGQANAPPPSLDTRVAEMVKSRILAKGVPSVSVAVMRDGKLLMEGAWGEASSGTLYPIGSVSKEFTAALVLKLVDRGRVSLTDPISKHLQGLTPELSGVTIEHLLNHTSGMPRDVRNPETRFENMSTDMLIQMAARAKLVTAPGAAFAYSNAGYTLLGALVGKAAGKPYGVALHDDIAAPLGLTTLARCGDPKPGVAIGYMLSDGKLGPPPGMHHSQLLGAGGVCTTAADLVKWRHALSGHTAELHWYPGQSLAVALLYNAAPRVPGVADLVPRIVLGVPLAVPKL